MFPFQRKEADGTIKGFHKKINFSLLDKYLAHKSDREQTCYGRAVKMEELVAVQEKCNGWQSEQFLCYVSIHSFNI